MTAIRTPKHIVAGFALAIVPLCLSVFYGTKLGDFGGRALMSVCYAAAVLTVIRVTFTWGELRGFPAVRTDGRLATGNIVRNLVMALVAWCILLLVSGPFVMAAFKLAR